MVVIAGTAAGCDRIANEIGVGVASAARRFRVWQSGDIDKGSVCFNFREHEDREIRTILQDGRPGWKSAMLLV